MTFIDEVEQQNEMHVKIQHLQQAQEGCGTGSRSLKLNQHRDLPIDEILKLLRK